MKAAAAIETNGVPLDMEGLQRLQTRWDDIQDELIREIDQDFDVYEGRAFKTDRFANYLARQEIPWPRW